MNRVSVVVASFRDPRLVRACLDSIGRIGTPDIRVVVARRAPASAIEADVLARPGFTLVEASSTADVPQLRGAGLREAADADWVAVTEDHCLVAPDWIDRLLEDTGPEISVVGGAMGNARPGPLNWGAFFSEYGFFAAARRTGSGRAPLLTGANVAYAKPVLEEVTRWASEGVWENVIHQRLHERGEILQLRPRATVWQNATYTFGSFCRDRFEHGRDFARSRLEEDPAASRARLLATTPLLPPVLAWRVARVTPPGERLAFARALPFTLGFLAAWSLGEATGYLLGPTRE